MTIGRRPCSANAMAALIPAGPAPTITTDGEFIAGHSDRRCQLVFRHASRRRSASSKPVDWAGHRSASSSRNRHPSHITNREVRGGVAFSVEYVDSSTAVRRQPSAPQSPVPVDHCRRIALGDFAEEIQDDPIDSIPFFEATNIRGRCANYSPRRNLLQSDCSRFDGELSRNQQRTRTVGKNVKSPTHSRAPAYGKTSKLGSCDRKACRLYFYCLIVENSPTSSFHDDFSRSGANSGLRWMHQERNVA